MLKKAFFPILLILIPFFCFSAVPRTISYQGIVVDNQGNPKPDGLKSFTFTLFTDSTTADSVWSEVKDITTKRGLFATNLGDKVPLTIPFDTQYWLSVTVERVTLPGRVRLTATPYALRADTAEVAKKLASQTSGQNVNFAGVVNADSLSVTKGIAVENGIAGTAIARLVIQTNSIDGSDTKSVGITGASLPISTTRSGYVIVAGNEEPTYKGNVAIAAGAGDGTTTGAISCSPRMYFSTRPSNDRNWNLALGRFFTFEGFDNDESYILHNTYYSSPGGWKYRESDANAGASLLKVGAGVFDFKVAGDGTKDNSIDWINSLKITNTGNVGIGKISPTYKLDVEGSTNIDSNLIVGKTATIDSLKSIKGINALSLTTNGNINTGSGDITTNTVYSKCIRVGTTDTTTYDPLNVNLSVGALTYYQNATTKNGVYTGAIFSSVANSGSTYQRWFMGAVSSNAGYAPHIVLGQRTGNTIHSERMRLNSLGYVGINDTAPSCRLDVAGSVNIDTNLIVQGKACIGIQQTSNDYQLYVNGSFYASAGPCCASDLRFKTNIDTIKNALSTIESLAGVTYNWKTEAFPERNFSKERQIGLIAQDVEKVLPEVVHTDADGYKSMSYDKLTAVLIEAVKSQQKIIESQKSINDNQQNEIEQLKTSLQELNAAIGLIK